MREDKKQYYVNGGGKRQLRMLNNRLENILVRNDDMKMLLEYLNVRYPVSFIVNLNTDTQRSIMVPDFFQRMLDGHGGSFRGAALREFCDDEDCSRISKKVPCDCLTTMSSVAGSSRKVQCNAAT
ncbi:MAG: hypothetical protein ACLT3W_01725 [Bifidobacterium pseudocatenulatum]